ncbi:helix-turn-helix transcriptional regulator [Actinoplanes sp. N902-109]|uniref:helix-turn-helix transcriptional regulator n=1 Tax=Actinoplanes sp. (strain N902-109) TaxID=649831 RepID=UPI000329406A|nr:helix-turn-helix transcriptional regulator [Actinoplanes sp. N902-109]AGL17581.1 LuxR family transcriptional regulator [Actinoplanes sp. N902-109]
MGAVVPVLTRWGVSADADLVYRALVQLDPRDAAGLARELGMPSRRVRDAIDELVALGAVAPGPGVVRPAAVDAVVGRLRQPRRRAIGDRPEESWRRHIAAVDGLGPLAAATVRRWSRAAARSRAAQLIAAERYEHLAINTEEVFSAESLSAARPLDRSMLDRGIRLLVVERPPLDGDLGVPGRSVADIPEGHYRQAEEVPLKLMVFDRRVAFFPADPLDLERGYVEVAEPDGVARCCALFYQLWATGRDPFREGVAPIELSTRERTLLRLLAAGHTDVTAAAAMGISPRAVSYAMRALMDRSGVENRFQLGLLLGATGTVRPEHLTNEED